MTRNSYIKKLISCLAVLVIVLSAFPTVTEGENLPVINISEPSDFAALTKNCTYDSYSRGMQVTLMNDIDMSVSVLTETFFV